MYQVVKMTYLRVLIEFFTGGEGGSLGSEDIIQASIKANTKCIHRFCR